MIFNITIIVCQSSMLSALLTLGHCLQLVACICIQTFVHIGDGLSVCHKAWVAVASDGLSTTSPLVAR